MNTKVKNLSQAQSIYDQELGRIKLLDTTIPEEPEPQNIIRQLEGLSLKHSTSVLTISMNSIPLTQKTISSTENPKENIVNFSFNGSANYQSLFGFLTDLEKMRRPIKILTLNFRTSSTESGETLNL